MENPDSEAWKKWLLENYPQEAVFIDEINKNVNDIYQHLGTHPNFKLDTPKDMKFQVVKRGETDYAELMLNPDAMLFIGGMAKAISSVILTEILPEIIPQTKKCKQCGARNNEIVNYCFQCGSKFDNIS